MLNFLRNFKECHPRCVGELDSWEGKSWGNVWPHMHHIIKEKLKKECRAMYQTLDNKLKRLSLQQTATPPTNPS